MFVKFPTSFLEQNFFQLGRVRGSAPRSTSLDVLMCLLNLGDEGSFTASEFTDLLGRYENNWRVLRDDFDALKRKGVIEYMVPYMEGRQRAYKYRLNVDLSPGEFQVIDLDRYFSFQGARTRLMYCLAEKWRKTNASEKSGMFYRSIEDICGLLCIDAKRADNVNRAIRRAVKPLFDCGYLSDFAVSDKVYFWYGNPEFTPNCAKNQVGKKKITIPKAQNPCLQFEKNMGKSYEEIKRENRERQQVDREKLMKKTTSRMAKTTRVERQNFAKKSSEAPQYMEFNQQDHEDFSQLSEEMQKSYIDFASWVNEFATDMNWSVFKRTSFEDIAKHGKKRREWCEQYAAKEQAEGNRIGSFAAIVIKSLKAKINPEVNLVEINSHQERTEEQSNTAVEKFKERLSQMTDREREAILAQAIEEEKGVFFQAFQAKMRFSEIVCGIDIDIFPVSEWFRNVDDNMICDNAKAMLDDAHMESPKSNTNPFEFSFFPKEEKPMSQQEKIREFLLANKGEG